MTGTEYKLKTPFSVQGPLRSGLWLPVQLYCLWIFLCSINTDSQTSGTGHGSSQFYALEDAVLLAWMEYFVPKKLVLSSCLFECHFNCYLSLLWSLPPLPTTHLEAPFSINTAVTIANIVLSIRFPPSILLGTVHAPSWTISPTITTW